MFTATESVRPLIPNREYTKMNSNRLNDLVRKVKANPQHMKLLQILNPQLNQLVTEGSPNLPTFWRDLKNEELISEDEHQELQGIFPLEHVSSPSTLSQAVN